MTWPTHVVLTRLGGCVADVGRGESVQQVHVEHAVGVDHAEDEAVAEEARGHDQQRPRTHALALLPGPRPRPHDLLGRHPCPNWRRLALTRYAARAALPPPQPITPIARASSSRVPVYCFLCNFAYKDPVTWDENTNNIFERER